MEKKVLGIIPARLKSVRLPNKPLRLLAGKPLIQHVWERAVTASQLSDLVVATDSEQIAELVKSFGGKAVITSSAHPTGTDRCAEVAQFFPDFDYYLNIQGDEPFLETQQIAEIYEAVSLNYDICTLGRKIETEVDFRNPNFVKIAISKTNKALFFTRAAIPFSKRNESFESYQSGLWHGVGMYIFSKASLEKIAQIQDASLWNIEDVEQLRWLEHDLTVHMLPTRFLTMCIDTEADLQKAENMCHGK